MNKNLKIAEKLMEKSQETSNKVKSGESNGMGSLIDATRAIVYAEIASIIREVELINDK